MTDLTVLISPTPLHMHITNKSPFSFRRSTPCLITPVMVTLETEREEQEESDGEEDEEEEDSRAHKYEKKVPTLDGSCTCVVEEPESAADIPPPPTDSEPWQPPARRRGRPVSRTTLDPNFLSPPINTFKSSSRRFKHKHTRSQSAPPSGSSRPLVEYTSSPQDSSAPFEGENSPKKFIPLSPSAAINNFNHFVESGKRSNGDLPPPPPSLLRPTTFWRKTRRSGVTSASYSPSYHLIRRSTFVAAGLDLDTPSHDLRAFCVENRIGFIVVPPDCSFL